MKKLYWLFCLIALALIIGVVGCGTSATESTTTTISTTTTTTTSSTATTTTSTTTTTTSTTTTTEEPTTTTTTSTTTTTEEPTTTTTTTSTTTTTAEFILTSIAFEDSQSIPAKYANIGVTGGQNISIPLSWEGTPVGTNSFALIMYDANAENFLHWAVGSFPSGQNSMIEGASGSGIHGEREFTNDFGEAGYGGPQPPQEDDAHTYVFRLYALSSFDMPASLPDDATFEQLIVSAEALSLGTTGLFGSFDW